jgi:hypothetical protein
MGPAGLVLALAGLAGGLALGLGLRPPPQRAPAPVASLAPTPQPSLAPAAPALTAAPPALPPADLAAQRAGLQADIAAEQARLESIRQARAAAEAELAALRQARVAAETDLAGLRRDLAASRRDLAAAQAGAPPQQLAPPPRPLRLPEPVAAAAAPPSQPRVYVHLRAGSAAAAGIASELAPQLREGGFDLVELRAVGATPSQRVVRYFHTEDAAAAARLAGRLGRGWAIQDFRNFEPAPSQGTLEIWLPDR